MRDDFNIQFSSQHLLEDIEETSTTSGVGTYQRKTPMAEKDTYKKHKGERTMHISHVNKVDSTDSTEDVDEGLNELFTREDYQKALDLLKKLETTNPKIYKAIKKIVLSAAVDPYNNTTYSDLETMASKGALAENYSKFKNETKTRSKPDQFHQAVREVKKRVHEINKVFEYVNRLKSELNESGELKYRRHTEAAMSKIKEMVNELNSKIKKFK